MNDLFLGIDTSNYKTSVAVTDSAGNIVFERSEFLEVPAGKRGLRQSEAFFRHSVRLPDFIAEMTASVDVSGIRACGVSSRPRRVEGSYMPCFLAGVNAAKEISSVLGIPCCEFSHQEGHAAAIIEDPGLEIHDPALFFHLSGGTTEFLLCRRDEAGYDMKIAGGSKDISIGQLIDRTGVAMGMPFPSGSYMDIRAAAYQERDKAPVSAIRITDGWFNLSGAETQVMKLIESGRYTDDSIIVSLFDRISALLLSSADYLSDKHSIDYVYMAGGVASSEYIRSHILQAPHHSDIIFGKPSLSGDNAAGTARLAARSFMDI